MNGVGQESEGEKDEKRQNQPHHGPQWGRYMREEGVHTQRNGIGECRECMQRNKKAGGGSLGAALVACLSMEHITTGFNSQRWKNHVPKAGQRRWGGAR